MHLICTKKVLIGERVFLIGNITNKVVDNELITVMCIILHTFNFPLKLSKF